MRPPPAFADLPNLGPATTRWLLAAGIRSRHDLERAGVIPACAAIRALGFPVSVLGAYAFQAALLGCHWQELPAEVKADLRRRFGELVRPAHPRNSPGRRPATARRGGR